MNKRPTLSPPNPDPVLHAKLMPPRLPSSLVHRGDLLRQLDSGLTRKLTLVTAPTGYGKTTLLRQWIADRKICAAWLTLDDGDNDPVRFWTYVITALRAIDTSRRMSARRMSALGKPALSALGTSQPVFFLPVLTALINDLETLDRNCVLVLEDYHAITSLEIQDTVAYLIQHLPDALHVVLISRNLPPSRAGSCAPGTS